MRHLSEFSASFALEVREKVFRFSVITGFSRAIFALFVGLSLPPAHRQGQKYNHNLAQTFPIS